MNPPVNKWGQTELRLRRTLSACERRDWLHLPPCSCLEMYVLQLEAVSEPCINTLNEQRRCPSASKVSLKMRQNQNTWCFCWRNASLRVGDRTGSWDASLERSVQISFLLFAEGQTFAGPDAWAFAGAELLAYFEHLQSRRSPLPLGEDALWHRERRGSMYVVLLRGRWSPNRTLVEPLWDSAYVGCKFARL